MYIERDIERYVYIYIYVYTYICIHTHIERERWYVNLLCIITNIITVKFRTVRNGGLAHGGGGQQQNML